MKGTHLGKRSKGTPIHGWLIVDKQAGYTSTALVNKVRWVLDAQKAGHAGTLDPEATGILAIALGEATKTIPYLTDAPKSYIFTITFGSSTDTDDASGKLLKTSLNRPSNDELSSVLQQFVGPIKQRPPNYSAVKVEGQRAYAIARNGEKELILKERDLLVEELEIVERVNIDTVKMRMVCGKGGYVRSITRDIGESLGCFAHTCSIRRTSSGPFELADCISDKIVSFGNGEMIQKRLLPAQRALNKLNSFECLTKDLAEIKNGKKIIVNNKNIQENSTVFTTFDSKIVAIGKIKNCEFYPKKVFSLT